jgi:hypothetical protein
MNVQREIREERGGYELSCWGKVRFAPNNRALAVKVANRMSKHKHQRITTFRCVYCDGWHVGNDMSARR